MYGGGIIFSMRSATHHGQVIGFIVGMFFILEVLCMLIFVGAYFTHDFTGVYFFLIPGFPLMLLNFREYGIEDFHLCLPTGREHAPYMYL